MAEFRLGMLARACLVTAVLVGIAVEPLRGQSTSSRPSDFLFERPRVALTLKGGMFLHRADGDLYDFTTERFTVDRGDYRAWAFGFDASAWVGDHTEIVFSLDGSRVSLASEYRDWLESIEGPGGSVIEVPIRQTTRLTQGPAVSIGFRVFLAERGDALGRFIWIPNGFNAFVGGGAGLTAYGLRLSGDFVNEADSTIQSASYRSEGNTAFPYLAAGVELGMSPRTALIIESRYQWGRHELGSDFDTDFVNPLDLSGARLTAGFQFRF